MRLICKAYLIFTTARSKRLPEINALSANQSCTKICKKSEYCHIGEEIIRKYRFSFSKPYDKIMLLVIIHAQRHERNTIMKTKNRILSMMLSIAIAGCVAVPLSARAAEDEIEKRTLTAYLYSLDSTKEIECVFSSNLPEEPYITAEDYLSCILDSQFSGSKIADGTYSVNNQKSEIVMVINTEADTVDLVTGSLDEVKPISEGTMIDAPYIKIIKNTQNPDVNNKNSFNFGEYGIDLLEYNGKAYFPLNTISDCFSSVYNIAEFYDDSIYFVHPTSGEKYYNNSSLFNITERTPEMVEYTYNELCLVMDNLYGYPSKAEISSFVKEKGFDSTLDEYSDESRKAKELLNSRKMTDFLAGLSYLSVLFYDGGHTIIDNYINTESFQNSVLDKEIAAMMVDQSNESGQMIIKSFFNYMNKIDAILMLKDERQKEYNRYSYVNSWEGEANTRFIRCDYIGVFIFDIFDNEVVEAFKWSLDYAAENGIKQFIVDVSCNTGGSSSVLRYMLGIMTNKDNHTNKAPAVSAGEALGISDALVDYNLDGKFDELDKEVSYDMDFAVLCSRFSFSCGNLLPVMAHDEGIAVLGERSGGGACSVVCLNFQNYIGYSISGSTKFISKSGEDVDNGVQVDFELEDKESGLDERDIKRFSTFYEVENIGELVESFYSQEENPASSAEESIAQESSQALQSQNSESETSSASSDGLLTVIICVVSGVAVLVIVAVVCIIFIRKKKK